MTSNNKTMPVRAPRRLMEELRLKFPELTDSNIIAAGLRTSLLMAEGKLRQGVSDEKRKKTKKISVYK